MIGWYLWIWEKAAPTQFSKLAASNPSSSRKSKAGIFPSGGMNLATSISTKISSTLTSLSTKYFAIVDGQTLGSLGNQAKVTGDDNCRLAPKFCPLRNFERCCNVRDFDETLKNYFNSMGYKFTALLWHYYISAVCPRELIQMWKFWV